MNNFPSACIRAAVIGRAVGVLGIVAVGGCGDASPTGQVSGTVVQQGRPLSGVMVSFLPDPLKGANGGVASAITDAEGRYRLDADEPGSDGSAVVGWHRVVVKDVTQEMQRLDQPQSPRVPLRFTLAGRTPLSLQIRPGPQVIDLEIPPR